MLPIEPITLKEFKEQLPQIRVKSRYSKKVLWAKTSGRKNASCTVTIFNEGTLHSGTVPYKDFHFSWEAVTKCYNTGKPLELP